LLEDQQRPEDERTALELMKISGENSLKLVNDLLQINAPLSGDLKKEPQDIEEIIRYCIDMLQHKVQEKGQQIELDTKPIILQLNYEKMWRVISNLVFNAIKFSPTGSKIHIGLEQIGKRVLIRVKDSGIGIPAELKDKVFDQFTTARRAGTSGEESSGLGLAISKQIVEAHGGKLSFEDNPDGGTTFIVELPLE
jgi:signal transduction histidine kinase